MKKPAKKWEVRSVRSEKFGLNIPIYLDKPTGEFYAQVGPFKVRKKGLDEAEGEVRKRIAEVYSFTWRKIIVVEVAEASPSFSSSRNNLGIVYDRHAIAERSGLTEMDKLRASYTHVERRPFMPYNDTPEDEFDYQIELYSGPSESKEDVFVLPYSEETWAALELIDDQITRMRESMMAFLAGKDLDQRLKRIATHGVSTMLLGPAKADP